MCGGYLSFAGSGGAAAYAGTPIETALPVTIARYDDRIEIPEGASPEQTATDHRLAQYFDKTWPLFLGYNRVTVRREADLIASIHGDPFVAACTTGKGRALVWTSDIGPHWVPEGFAQWHGFGKLWINALSWLTGGG